MNIPATNWKSSPITGVNIETDSLLLTEGQMHQFKNLKGYPRAFYDNNNVFQKLDNDSGYLYISKFDKINRILSGTFSFVGTNANGEKVNVTEGRFDIIY